jgi:hypothetical protein
VRRAWLVSLTVSACGVACSKDILVGADPGDGAGLDASVGDAYALDGSGDANVGPDDTGFAADADATLDAGVLDSGGLISVPWSTGFENGFGDWSQPDNQGYCYVAGAATYAIVTSPVHSGQYAAAFTVNPAVTAPSQTRCVRQGVLPQSAYYGAWYYVPTVEAVVGNWNLFHFQGADAPDAAFQGLWDISLANQQDGGVAASVFDFLNFKTSSGPAIPIGRWFHLEARLVRSATGTGEFTVYIDGSTVLDLTGLETDPTSWGQWYIGNYATSLTPSPSTVYVDDVTIDTSGP